MGDTRVRDIMSDSIVTISSDDTLSTVEDIMTLGRVRHMPVVRLGKLVGVVSERDLLRASLSNLTSFGTRAAARLPPGCRDPARDVRAAGRDPSRGDGGGGRPGDGRTQDRVSARGRGPERLLGMLTETDVLRYFAGVAPESQDD